jgi:hypothetical protein
VAELFFKMFRQKAQNGHRIIKNKNLGYGERPANTLPQPKRASGHKGENRTVSLRRSMTNGSILPPEAIAGILRMLANGHPDIDDMDEGSMARFHVDNEQSILHGKTLVLEKMKNGLFRLVNSKTKKTEKDGPEEITVDLEKKIAVQSDNLQKSGMTIKRASQLAKMSTFPADEYDNNGRPTEFLRSLHQWGASSKNDAAIQSRNIYNKLLAKGL